MSEKLTSKNPKERPENYEKRLKVTGTLDDVLKASVQKPKEKEEPKK